MLQTGMTATIPTSIEALESERDALADQVGQDFEELHWLHSLATVVSSCDATVELGVVAEQVLPDLRGEHPRCGQRDIRAHRR